MHNFNKLFNLCRSLSFHLINVMHKSIDKIKCIYQLHTNTHTLYEEKNNNHTQSDSYIFKHFINIIKPKCVTTLVFFSLSLYEILWNSGWIVFFLRIHRCYECVCSSQINNIITINVNVNVYVSVCTRNFIWKVKREEKEI